MREEREGAPAAARGARRQPCAQRAPSHAEPVRSNGAPQTAAKPGQRRAAKAKAKPKGPSKNRLSAQQKAERAVEQAEAALASSKQELADPAAWATRYEAAKSEARHTAAKRAVERPTRSSRR